MKILQVITSLRFGGAEKLVVDITIGLRRFGHDVDVILFDGIETPLKQQLSGTGCKIYNFGHSVYSPLCIFKLMKIMGKYDIVHTHNTSPQFYVAIANCFVHTKLVTTEHNTSNRRRVWMWFRPIDRWMYQQYHRIICISDQANINLKEYLEYCKTSIITIYNGIDIDSFHNAQPIENLHPEGKTVVVMVAAFRAQKDQDTLVRAMALLPQTDFELWLVGGGGERIDIIKELVNELHIQKNVVFWGNRVDVPEILKTADIVVMSSHYEGLSLSSIEGMAVGKPFVASNVDGLREITEGAGILFKHQNEKELADIIYKLAKDESYWQSIASSCYERAKKYDISLMLRRYEQLYLTI